ncbi:MAG: hypothetical protein ACRD9L_03320 [Bryobacteraceae bacterium]
MLLHEIANSSSFRELGAALLVCATPLAFSSPAFASLILEGSASLNGTGLGNVNTVLTIQAHGSSATESGCVGFDGTGDTSANCGFADSDVKTGASQTGTVTPAQIDVSAVSNLRVVLNAPQPAGGPIALTGLVLSFYDASGKVLFASSGLNDMSGTPVSSIAFPSTASGTGNSGFVFALDASQSTLAEAVYSATTRIGLGASANLAAGGPETFFLANAQTIGSVPESSTAGLIAIGLVLLFASRGLARKTRHWRE